MSKSKFLSRYPTVAAMLGSASQVAITGGDETVEISAEDLQANIEADTQSQIDAAREEAGDSTQAVADERKRWATVLADDDAKKHTQYAMGYLQSTDMSADDIIAQCKGMDEPAGGAAPSTRGTEALSRLNADGEPGAEANPDTGEANAPAASDDDDAKKAREDRKARLAETQEKRNKRVANSRSRNKQPA